MAAFDFEPVLVNSGAPGGARANRHVGQAVLADLVQASFGARRPEAHAAVRDALAAEGWLAD
jgi:hypothetical protein